MNFLWQRKEEHFISTIVLQLSTLCILITEMLHSLIHNSSHSYQTVSVLAWSQTEGIRTSLRPSRRKKESTTQQMLKYFWAVSLSYVLIKCSVTGFYDPNDLLSTRLSAACRWSCSPKRAFGEWGSFHALMHITSKRTITQIYTS